ncbi:hypothetical protein [Cellulomonas fimi]|uniref:hypothetical protein n=1 Tax=Cellulomonas fimi TaxID=1708 RepID=UPI002012F6B9|nr:hypothetical protein [Cellulomonas fimi]
MTTEPTGHVGPGPTPRTWVPAPAGEPQPALASTDQPGVPTARRSPDQPAATPVVEPGRRRRWPVVVLAVLLVLALALAGYLWTTTRAYQERAAGIEEQAREIGTQLTTTRAELAGATAELEAVRSQLDTAQARITALADEKAQVGDDREAQRQLVDYQQRVSEAAGVVASALTRCVEGQDQLIAYLGNAAAYDPAELARFGTQVESLCRSATEANQSLQEELSR